MYKIFSSCLLRLKLYRESDFHNTQITCNYETGKDKAREKETRTYCFVCYFTKFRTLSIL